MQEQESKCLHNNEYMDTCLSTCHAVIVLLWPQGGGWAGGRKHVPFGASGGFSQDRQFLPFHFIVAPVTVASDHPELRNLLICNSGRAFCVLFITL